MSEIEQLQETIAALESQRPVLGDRVVDTALAPLRQQLDELQKDQTATDPAFEGERRIVTVLFCDVVGSTALAEQWDPEEWTNLMNITFEGLIEPVERYGGTVARLMGDAILAFFGAPIAHEDDPQRAVRAGLDMLENMRPLREKLGRERGMNFNVRVGINTGLAVVGQVGTEAHGEYTAMGDAVNLAARMEQTAEPGTVQIAASTYKLAASTFEFQALGAISVKGKHEPVPAYQVLGIKSKPQPVRGLVAHGIHSTLVGREADLLAAKEAVKRTAAGEGGILSIIGEAGIGKSRLVAELHQSLLNDEQLSISWLEGRTLSYGQTISYWPFQDILRGFAGINDDDDEAQAWSKLEAKVKDMFPETVAEILPFLASLLTLEVREAYAERIKYLDREAMGDQILLAVRRLFERLAQEQPLVLVFEDLHWADNSSARLLERLLPMSLRVPILFCGLSRPDPDSPGARLREISANVYSERYTEIILRPLSKDDGIEMVNNLLQIDGLSTRAQAMILDKADGNPFYLEEIIRDLIEAGAIAADPESGRWQATVHMESIAIPDTIQGVIIARIDRLDEDVNHVLRTASVIGRAFLYRVLDAVLQVDGQLEQHLAALQAMELIHEKQLMPELEYIFKHALAQEATYESILHQTRRQLHFQVGQALEALFVNHLEEYYGLLAYHYAQADVRDSYCLSFYKYWNLLQDKILKHSLNRTGVGACSSFGIYPNDLSVKLQTDLSSCAQRFISCVARSLQGSKKYAKMPPSDFE